VIYLRVCCVTCCITAISIIIIACSYRVNAASRPFTAGLMWTAALVYHTLNALRITVNIRNVCVLLAPFMASNTTV